MLTVDLPKEVEDRLEHLARQTGRSKAYHAKQAITEWLEDQEDYRRAVKRLEEDKDRHSLEELEKGFGLAD